jgi:hypothetical protein
MPPVVVFRDSTMLEQVVGRSNVLPSAAISAAGPKPAGSPPASGWGEQRAAPFIDYLSGYIEKSGIGRP